MIPPAHHAKQVARHNALWHSASFLETISGLSGNQVDTADVAIASGLWPQDWQMHKPRGGCQGASRSGSSHHDSNPTGPKVPGDRLPQPVDSVLATLGSEEVLFMKP